jgi:hypothetical protein
MPLQIYYPPLQNPNDPNSPRIAPWGDWVAYGYSEDPIKIYRAELVSTQGNQYQEYLAVLLDMPNECTHAWAVFFQDVVPPISGYYTLKLTVAVFNPSCDTPVAPPKSFRSPTFKYQTRVPPQQLPSNIPKIIKACVMNTLSRLGMWPLRTSSTPNSLIQPCKIYQLMSANQNPISGWHG